MPIAVSCPSCGGAIKVPDHLAGKKVKCPKCADIITVHGAETGSAAIQTPPPPLPPESAAPPPRQRSARPRQDDAADRYDDDRDDDRRYDDERYDDVERVRASHGGNNGLAIAGMILGIVGFLVVFIPCVGWLLAIVLGIVGATLSGIGLGTAGKYGGGKGMAIAGLVLSILAIIWVPVWIFIIVGSTVNAFNQAVQQAAQNNPQVIMQDKGFVIQPGGAPQGPPTPATGKLTLNNGQATQQDNLAANDPRDRSRPASVCKVFTIDMVAGKTYQIDMIRGNDAFDPYLRLEDPAGTQVAFDDDGGNDRNARLRFTCPADGEYRIVATTFLGGMGNFTLQVSEQ